MGYFFLPDKRMSLPTFPLLRTVRETFTSHSSSLWKGFPCWNSRKFKSTKFTSRYCMAVGITRRHTGRTSSRPSFAFIRFLHSLHDQIPAERLPYYWAENISPGILPITNRHSFFFGIYSSPATVCLAVNLPRRAPELGFLAPNSWSQWMT